MSQATEQLRRRQSVTLETMSYARDNKFTSSYEITSLIVECLEVALKQPIQSEFAILVNQDFLHYFGRNESFKALFLGGKVFTTAKQNS